MSRVLVYCSYNGMNCESRILYNVESIERTVYVYITESRIYSIQSKVSIERTIYDHSPGIFLEKK